MREIKVLFVDLDGTVRHGYKELKHGVRHAGDVKVWPEAVERLWAWVAPPEGGRIVVVSNQIQVGLGNLTHDQMMSGFEETNRQCDRVFDVMLACTHGPGLHCFCQKPRYGLLVEGMIKLAEMHPDEDYRYDQMLMVGDSDDDRGCAEAAGIRFQTADAWRRGW